MHPRRAAHGSDRSNLVSIVTPRHAEPISRAVTFGHMNINMIPTLFFLNAAALTKPNAVQQLAAELTGNDIDAAVITETHLKSKHTDQ